VSVGDAIHIILKEGIFSGHFSDSDFLLKQINSVVSRRTSPKPIADPRGQAQPKHILKILQSLIP